MKINKLLISIATLGVLLVGCSNEPSDTMQQESSQSVATKAEDSIGVVIEVTNDSEAISSHQIITSEGTTLLEAMKDNDVNFEESEGFISSIDNVEQSPEENKYWVYTVNGEQVSVGANEYKLQEGDNVVWELTQF